MSQALTLDALPRIGPAAVTLGVFDGVHRGHQHLVETTRQAAAANGALSVALVFDPPPIEVIQSGTQLARLAPLDVNLALLREVGIDHAIPLRFDEALRALPAADFVAGLAPAIELRAMVMTSDSAFGHDRDGTPESMAALGARRGFEVTPCDALLVDGAPVSSSRIRAAIETGNIGVATELLGRPPLLRGTVVAGDRRGRALGFPTANLAFDYHAAMPALGIYAGRVAVPERGVGPDHPALVSIGVRPTFHSAAAVLVEAYLLDFDADLYGAELTLCVERRLREERRFADVDELIAQMRRDEAEARALFGMGA